MVQFMDKVVDVPVAVHVRSGGRDSARNCGGSAVAVHRRGQYMDKVVDVPVVVNVRCRFRHRRAAVMAAWRCVTVFLKLFSIFLTPLLS